MGDRGTHVMYAEGQYEGPLLRRLIHGRCVLVMQSEYSHTEDQTVFVTSKLDMFVRFDNAGAELIARTLHPLVGKSADHNFIESTRFVGEVSKAAEKKSAKLQKFTEKLTKVQPKDSRAIHHAHGNGLFPRGRTGSRPPPRRHSYRKLNCQVASGERRTDWRVAEVVRLRFIAASSEVSRLRRRWSTPPVIFNANLEIDVRCIGVYPRVSR